MFDSDSRYAEVPQSEWISPEGKCVRYVQRRFPRALPPAFPSGATTVQNGERVEHLATRALGDPKAYWRICDANAVLHPLELIHERERPVVLPPPGW